MVAHRTWPPEKRSKSCPSQHKHPGNPQLLPQPRPPPARHRAARPVGSEASERPGRRRKSRQMRMAREGGRKKSAGPATIARRRSSSALAPCRAAAASRGSWSVSMTPATGAVGHRLPLRRTSRVPSASNRLGATPLPGGNRRLAAREMATSRLHEPRPG